MKTGQETGHSFDANNNCAVPVELFALLLMHKQRTVQIKTQTMLKKKCFQQGAVR